MFTKMTPERFKEILDIYKRGINNYRVDPDHTEAEVFYSATILYQSAMLTLLANIGAVLTEIRDYLKTKADLPTI